ncbi:unnamed protein product [Pieris macdunnoughi]|uniref:Uncharacterized protein n=1 Tax=Pieris macdunnoughi TaxID=345717 RepID=A0A821W6H6_9NEOP|nr:unnamed protein product [Pieris macdunnoughi]
MEFSWRGLITRSGPRSVADERQSDETADKSHRTIKVPRPSTTSRNNNVAPGYVSRAKTITFTIDNNAPKVFRGGAASCGRYRRRLGVRGAVAWGAFRPKVKAKTTAVTETTTIRCRSRCPNRCCAATLEIVNGT